jgi:hypothetical protein
MTFYEAEEFYIWALLFSKLAIFLLRRCFGFEVTFYDEKDLMLTCYALVPAALAVLFELGCMFKLFILALYVVLEPIDPDVP